MHTISIPQLCFMPELPLAPETPCFAAQSAPSISCYREVGPHNHSFLESANRGRSTVNALSSFLRDGHQWAKV